MGSAAENSKFSQRMKALGSFGLRLCIWRLPLKRRASWMSRHLLLSVTEVLLQDRSVGTLINFSVGSPRPGTGGGLRPMLWNVALAVAAL